MCKLYIVVTDGSSRHRQQLGHDWHFEALIGEERSMFVPE